MELPFRARSDQPSSITGWKWMMVCDMWYVKRDMPRHAKGIAQDLWTYRFTLDSWDLIALSHYQKVPRARTELPDERDNPHNSPGERDHPYSPSEREIIYTTIPGERDHPPYVCPWWERFSALNDKSLARKAIHTASCMYNRNSTYLNTWGAIHTLTRQPLGLRATLQPLGGHKVAPLYFCDDIVRTRKDREAKFCTHVPEYLAEVVSKFGVDPIWNDVTVTSEVKL